jgi:hypothetical protein
VLILEARKKKTCLCTAIPGQRIVPQRLVGSGKGLLRLPVPGMSGGNGRPTQGQEC